MQLRRATCLLLISIAALAVAPVRAAALEGVPHFDHIAVVVLENESFDATWGPSSPAAYLNSLRAQGGFADQYYAIGHASLDNYIAMVSGQPDQPITGSDCAANNLYTCAQAQLAMSNGRNLSDQLDAAQLSWRGYMDSMPSPCFHADYSPTAAPPDPYQGHSTAPPAGNYADRHNPYNYFPDIVGNDGRCTEHVLPYTSLAGDLRANRLPAFSFITPDTCHDGHDAPCAGGEPGGLVSADAWLKAQMPPLIRYLNAHHGLLLITTDESSSSDWSGCCTGGPGGSHGFGGRVGLLALGAGVPQGQVSHTPYDHASLLRTVEDSFGISEHLNNASTATPMTGVLRAPAAQVPETATPAALVLVAGTALLFRRGRQRMPGVPSPDR
jgi:phospholipase C